MDDVGGSIPPDGTTTGPTDTSVGPVPVPCLATRADHLRDAGGPYGVQLVVRARRTFELIRWWADPNRVPGRRTIPEPNTISGICFL